MICFRKLQIGNILVNKEINTCTCDYFLLHLIYGFPAFFYMFSVVIEDQLNSGMWGGLQIKYIFKGVWMEKRLRVVGLDESFLVNGATWSYLSIAVSQQIERGKVKRSVFSRQTILLVEM